MSTSRPEIAFLAAALVLLVLPVLVLLGLSVFGIALQFGMTPRMMSADWSAAFLVLFFVWVLLVLAVVVGLVWRLTRTTRS